MEKIKLSEFTIKKIKNRDFEKVIPELYELEKVIQNNPWHNESVLEHTFWVISGLNDLFESASEKIKKRLEKKIGNHSRKDFLILAAIFHDLGKKESRSSSVFLGHEKISAEKLKSILLRFDLTEKEREFVIKIVKNHDFIHEIFFNLEENPSQKWMAFQKENPGIFLELALLGKADILGSQLKKNMPEEFEKRVDFINKIIDSY